MEIYDIIKDGLLSFGFPIVMCLMMWYRMIEEDKNHDTETKSMIQALDNNTKALERLEIKIDGLNKSAEK